MVLGMAVTMVARLGKCPEASADTDQGDDKDNETLTEWHEGCHLFAKPVEPATYSERRAMRSAEYVVRSVHQSVCGWWFAQILRYPLEGSTQRALGVDYNACRPPVVA